MKRGDTILSTVIVISFAHFTKIVVSITGLGKLKFTKYTHVSFVSTYTPAMFVQEAKNLIIFQVLYLFNFYDSSHVDVLQPNWQ